tara:strand:- start:56 stop:889 length:834 start_codon:yes stop_codon:yes gene_type:complete
MILWLASYPKSGNTWMRAMLSSYLFEEHHKDNQDIFSKMKLIQSFPVKRAFEGIVDERVLKKNRFEAFKYFIEAQRKINKDPKLHIIKTHSFCGAANGHEFTNKENTLGSIYIVRDPRSAAVSYAHHAGITYEKSVNLMLDEGRIVFHDKHYPEARLSWKTHLASWLRYPSPRLLIRYEDMLDNPANILKSTILFINKFINSKIEIKDDKILKVIDECKFENLKKIENEIGFKEKGSNSDNFFRKGEKNEWKKALPSELVKKLEDNFLNEMKNLNYI